MIGTEALSSFTDSLLSHPFITRTLWIIFIKEKSNNNVSKEILLASFFSTQLGIGVVLIPTSQMSVQKSAIRH